MPRFAIGFLVIALISAPFAFGGAAGYSWEGARAVFIIFIAFGVLSLLDRAFRRRPFRR